MALDDQKIQFFPQISTSPVLNSNQSVPSSKTGEEDPDNTRNFNTMPRNYSEKGAINDSFQLTQEVFDKDSNWFVKLLSGAIGSIKVTGFNCNSIPAITNLTQFMNEALYLRKHNQVRDATEIEFLSGVLMITTKRQNQAMEVFRRI
jgi:hypothetical protein